MYLSFALLSSKKHGWRFEKLRAKFKKWVRINHPPQNRSPVIKLDDSDHSKLLYITNGRISPMKQDEFLKYGQTYIKKDNGIHTPSLAFSKGGSHILLEVFTMDEIEQIEKIVPEIRKAFDECESKITKMVCTDHKAIDYGMIKE
ncbi:hypothetical protein BEWA_018650 [Theileria equi strain WA]|uniref:Uncharacterized protein n=1 Tax=Theileria equi strain WA TaxID=1537102 RepID=L0AU00_THEEQ|nr:hypothetical protein BEWA_018650 [Theileria equi strain WA]AFZ79020.1 hypothetical protein BEWA_018650 [Theileria equi strain WA]|eukprot:XP_004828686.1 hypothetical protein BEWA_018650 [Theileria equi strain WA]